MQTEANFNGDPGWILSWDRNCKERDLLDGNMKLERLIFLLAIIA